MRLYPLFLNIVVIMSMRFSLLVSGSSFSNDAIMAAFGRTVLPSLSTFARHKGDCGRLAVLGGSVMYTGAPYYAAMAAMRSGSDLVSVFCMPEAAVAIKSYSPELMVWPALPSADANPELVVVDAVAAMVEVLPRVKALVVGPGLGRAAAVMAAVAGVIDEARRRDMPLVVDGDGLQLLVQNPRMPLPRTTVLTPNAMEFRRLYKAVFPEDAAVAWDALADDAVQLLQAHESARGCANEQCSSTSTSTSTATEPVTLASLPGHPAQDAAALVGATRLPETLLLQQPLLRLCQTLGVTIVQKGAVDLISNGRETWFVAVGGSPRRCGGQGDLLAGITGLFALYAQQACATTPADADAATVDLHMSALFAAASVVRFSAATAFNRNFRSTTASEILDEIPIAMQTLFPTAPVSSPKL
jgi:hydroxyethylthiazole kinase-like uncharacterized protein yjeF